MSKDVVAALKNKSAAKVKKGNVNSTPGDGNTLDKETGEGNDLTDAAYKEINE